MPNVRPQDVPVYRGLSLSVRPARVAVFFRSDEYWMATAERILENFSRVWGGAGNILVPCDANGGVAPVFYRVLRAFDPDYLATYSRSPMDLKLRDPADFKREFESSVAALVGGGTERDSATELVENEIQQPFKVWEPSEETTKNVLRCCAPLHHAGQAYLLDFQADCAPAWELTDVASIVGIERQAYKQVDTGSLDASTRLMVASRIGAISPLFRQALTAKRVLIQGRTLSPTDLPAVWEDCWERTGRACAGPRGRGKTWGWSAVPLGRTMVACGDFVERAEYFRRRRPFFLVVGDAAQDYCLWLALDRITDRAVWVPASFAENKEDGGSQFNRALIGFLQSAVGERGTHAVLHITSLSLDAARLEAVTSAIRDACSPLARYRIDAVIGSASDGVPIKRRLRCLEEASVNIVRNAPFVGEIVAGLVDTPIPQNVRTEPESALRWVVDISVQGYAPPPRAALAKTIAVGDPRNLPDLRCSEKGLSYPSQGIHQISERLQDNIVRPRFRLPGAETMFGALLEAEGLRLELSDKGRYMAAALRLWGGLEDLATDLLDEKRAVLLEGFVRGRDEEGARGWFLSGSKRRYLSFVDAVMVSGLSQSETRSVLDGYVDRAILSRGLILQCRLCRHTAWYGLQQISDAFSCKRCRSEAKVTADTWSGSAEPRWYYELSEVVYQALRHDGRYPVLALDELKKGAFAFQFAPELTVLKEDEKVAEIDIWVVRDSEIVVGEVKKTDRVADSNRAEKEVVSRLRRIGSAVAADWLLFATGAPKWRDATIATIEKGLRGSGLRTWFLEAIGSPGGVKSRGGPRE